MVVDDHDDENSTGFPGSSCGFQVMPKFAARPTSTQPGATSPTNFSHERQKYKNYKIQKQIDKIDVEIKKADEKMDDMITKTTETQENFLKMTSRLEKNQDSDDHE